MFDVVPQFQLGRFALRLDRVSIMGILNVTPDSFSDGGKHSTIDLAVAAALKMQADGADIIDVGGESTRPGAEAVSAQEEIDRVAPVIERLGSELRIPISIDTSKALVMRAAVAAGAVLINDVRALQNEGAMQAAASLNVPVVLMHMQATPETMQQAPEYVDVVEEVARFLAERIFAAQLAGIDKKKIMIDPGFGFGKGLRHNLDLLANLARFQQLEAPLLVGMSRKSMIGDLTGKAKPDERLAGSIAAHLVAVMRGAQIIRTHDVAETSDALKVYAAVPAARVSRTSASPDLSAFF